MSRGCCRCRYESGRPICCLVDQDDASSPDQAGGRAIDRHEHVEPGELESWNLLAQSGSVAKDCDTTASKLRVINTIIILS